ncbi:MAG TPA: hypothetical protein VJA94_20570 [Candidatus Angelobacter sp.]
MSGSLVEIQSAQQRPDEVPYSLLVQKEKHFALLLRAYIGTGLLFMLLPGTFLGVWNLISISNRHGSGELSPAWIQAHGHAQVFGWIGSFILGLGFYSLPHIKISARGTRFLSGWLCWGMWTSGVLLRWLVNSYLWHWRVLLPVSAVLELAAFLIFFRAVSSHKRLPSAQKKPLEMWMVTVILATCAFLLALIVNLGGGIYVAWAGDSPAFPHRFDQRYLVLLGWGVLVPMVWGFTARWVPVFLGLEQPQEAGLLCGIVLNYAGVAIAASGFFPLGCLLLLVGALVVALALRIGEPAQRPAKLIGVHHTFPVFVRVAYVWMIVAAALGVWASRADRAGGIWGASRHALTVGFISTMVFAIGPRVLPFFAGFVRIFSTRLMFAALALLNLGCFLRVTSEVVAYEGYGRWAWNVLPVSAVIELTAVSLFALNLVLMFLRNPKSEELATKLAS